LVEDCIDYAFGFAAGDCAALLAELARVLRPGGVAAIQVADLELLLGYLEIGVYPLAVLADLSLPERGRAYRLVVLERLLDP